MGEFILKGPGALDLIQRLTTNDAAKLTAGKAQYSCFTNAEGGIVDDLLVYCIEEGKVYMIVVNASNIEKGLDVAAGAQQDRRGDAQYFRGHLPSGLCKARTLPKYYSH
jgi:glycine cleavage system aminomethyltransferase T